MRNIYHRFLILSILMINCFAFSQVFTRLTIDEETHLRRSSWIDFDNDGDLDLYFGISNGADTSDTHDKLYRNDGNDIFTDVTSADMLARNTFTIGLASADYDNDGNMDIFISSINPTLSTSLGSFLLQNDGAGSLTLISDGDIDARNTISAFGSGWADYDNDGDLDLFIVTPDVSAYPEDTLSNVLFDNNGDGSFARNHSSGIVNDGFAAYQSPTWSDVDLDGDMDLFITRGSPTNGGASVTDNLYINQLKETGAATFLKQTEGALVTDPREGIDAKFVDYDNDGDLDVYIINWGSAPPNVPPNWPGKSNNFYRNDGDGTFTQILPGTITTDINISTAQVWGDLDNDGDLDAYVTSNTSLLSLGGNKYYRNSGPPNYLFSSVPLGDATASGKGSQGAAAADYDNDGDLDLYVQFLTLAGFPAVDALYRNDEASGNSWLKIEGVGMTSNRSAIGAKVRAKATVFGNTYWQLREIANRQSYGYESSMRIHFGFGDATVVDSLVIEWPSGIIDIYEDVEVNQFITAIEGQTVTSIEDHGISGIPSEVTLSQNYPNPFNPSTTITYSLPHSSTVSIKIYNIAGEEVSTLVNESKPAGTHSVIWVGENNRGLPLPSGLYVYKLTADGTSISKRMLLLK